MAVEEVGGGGESIIVYKNEHRAVGMVMSLKTDIKGDFVRNMDMAMRKGWRYIVGRDHASLKSPFYASCGIVHGDVWEPFVLRRIRGKMSAQMW